MEKILSNLKQNEQLATLKDWLLPMLMNGQITVGQIPGKQKAEESTGSSVEPDLGMVVEPSEEYITKRSL